MSRRAFPATEEPRVAAAIQHVPSRAHLLPRLLGALGATHPENGIGSPSPWHALALVTGDPVKRDPWQTYQSCLGMTALACSFGGCDDPDCDQLGATHLLVIQDDALPVPRFYERVVEAVRSHPGDLLCLYVPEHPTYMGRAMLVAQQAGRDAAVIPGGMFVPLVAAVWPVWMVEEALAWIEVTPMTKSRRCDDAQVARFMRRRRYQALGVVPSLVDHDELTPSTLGLGRYKRHAMMLAE